MADTPKEKPDAPTQGQKQHSLYLKTMSLAVELGFIIAVPLVLFAYLGKFLDSRYQTGNKMYLYAGIILALVTTCLLFIKKIKDIMKDMQK